MRRILIVMLCIVVSALGRTAVAQDLATGGASVPAVSARQLDAADVEGIKRALDGKTAGEINALLPTLVPGDVPITNSLGQASTDLVYVPVTPCRVIDTRVAGGKFAANQTRSYHIAGVTNYSTIGGNPAGCGIPAGNVSNPIDVSGIFLLTFAQKVRALALNIIAVNPDGAGDIRAWPTNQTMGTASVINYAAYSGLNIANGITQTSCDAFYLLGTVCPDGDVSFYAESAGTHLVVDVAGYFIPATGYGRRGSNASDTNTTLGTTCANLLAVSVNNNSDYNRTVVCTASANLVITHTGGTTDFVLSEIADAATACPVPPIGESGQAVFSVLAGAEPGFHYDTPHLLKTFELDANTSATYYLNSYTYLGAGTNSSLGHSMTCFIP